MAKLFSSSQVARVAGMTSANFRMQFTRNHWRLFSNERPENGESHKFTLGQAMVYALARKLTEHGFTAYDAFSTALHGLEQSSIEQYFGEAGELFNSDKGDTYFIAYPAVGTCAPHGEPIRAHDLPGLDGLFVPYGVGDGIKGVESFIVINLTTIRDRVVAELADVDA